MNILLEVYNIFHSTEFSKILKTNAMLKFRSFIFFYDFVSSKKKNVNFTLVRLVLRVVAGNFATVDDLSHG